MRRLRRDWGKEERVSAMVNSMSLAAILASETVTEKSDLYGVGPCKSPRISCMCVACASRFTRKNMAAFFIIKDAERSNHYQAAMALDLDREDDWTTAPERFLNMRYEHEMQDAIEWLDEGHFISQEWFRNGQESAVQLSTKRPLVVHTFLRDGNHESYAHDAHPLVAFVHLLKEAPIKSEVFVSMPYFTDFSVMDHLAHYAKSEADGGRDLQIKIIFGPDAMNKAELQRFIGHSRARYEAIASLTIHEYGICHTPQRPGKLMHSKTIITATAGMTGSYNYTYESRYRHGEDGLVFEDKETLNMYQKIFRSVWDKTVRVQPEEPKDTKKQTAEELQQNSSDSKFGMD